MKENGYDTAYIVTESGDNCYDSGSFNRNSHILSGGSYEKREKYRGCDLYPSYGAAAYSSRLFSVAPFRENSMLGAWLMEHGIPVVFSQTGMVIASAVVSFPLLYRTARGAFEQMDKTLVYAGQTLGLGNGTIFFKIVCPNCLPVILAGVILAFTRAMGEFGATIMLAGNIPNKTQTAAIAIYTAMQSGNRELAFQWALLIVGMSVFFIVLMNVITGRKGGRTWH